MIKYTFPLRILTCLFALSANVFAQGPTTSFCTVGVQADGFVDWSKLPATPASGGVNTTIPVTGVPDLSANLQITNPTPPTNPGQTGYYGVQNAADLQIANGLNPIIFFSKPVKGVSVQFQTAGRFGHNFKMTAYNNAGTITLTGPPDQQVDSNGFDRGDGLLVTSPLQIRSAATDIVAVSFDFTGSPEEYGPFDLINLRVESGSAPDPALQVPTTGLREWLRADRINFTGSAFSSFFFNVWPDQSGRGSDAVVVTSPTTPYGSTIIAGPNCTQVVQPAPMNFTLPINGWTEMTVFLAAQAYTDSPGWSNNQALIWNESEQWGTTFFTPSQSNIFFRFGTTQANNQPIYARPSNIGGDFGVTTAVHNGTTDSLYVNGLLALQQSGKQAAIAGTLPTATVGTGLSGSVFHGNIGEILIYDRVLSDQERQIVEHYLANKYGTH
jgi:hypothetical protein